MVSSIVAEANIDQDLLRFIQAYLPSVEHLEILLLLSSSGEHWWTIRAVNDLLRSSEDSVRARLRELAAHNLIEKSPLEECYRLLEHPRLQDLVARLKDAYKERRVRVIELIYSPKSKEITEFSRAFDFRKGGK